MHAVLATVLVACLGAAMLWWGTEGGRAFTSEAALRLEIAAAPRALPDVTLQDQSGAELRLSDYRGAPVVLEFMYTACPDICLALGSAFERLDATLPPQARLLSISFDPAEDVERLGLFADRHGAMTPRWRVAHVPAAAARAALLQRAGVVVISDGMGGFVHNAGLYLVDEAGHLTAVFESQDTDGLSAVLLGDAP